MKLHQQVDRLQMSVTGLVSKAHNQPDIITIELLMLLHQSSKMNMKKLFGILMFLILVNTPRLSFAQEKLNLTYYPTTQEIQVMPGETKSFAVVFVNNEDVPVVGTVAKKDFLILNSDGIPTLVENPSSSSRYSAVQWVTLPYESATIAAKDQLVVYAKVIVPPDALPGGHYVAVYFQNSNEPPTSSSRGPNTAISNKYAALVLFHVPGEFKEQADVKKFTAKSFSEYGPITLDTQIFNSGYLHIKPMGRIQIYNLLGKKVEDIALKEKNIFPEAAVNYQNLIGQKWMVGRYRAELNATFADKKLPLSAVVEFWVFPWRVTLAVVLALIIIILIAKSLIEKTVVKEAALEKEVEREKSEIEKLKEELKKRE